MRHLRVLLVNLTYLTLSTATDAFPLNVGFIAAYADKKTIALFNAGWGVVPAPPLFCGPTPTPRRSP